jgi:ABC-2 type transport system ATP-binding protein
MIDIQNLCRHFGPVTAVRNLTLQIPEGEVFCFLGPNGAGKTTTMKILTGLLRPSSGTAAVAGMDVQREPLKVKKLIGYIPDMPFMYDRLTALEFLQFTGDLYNLPRETTVPEAEKLLSLFGLQGFRGSLIKDLSHGMRQRLIYCSTFLHAPKVLFIDEPLIGLDPYSIRLIKDLLKKKARAGMTIFLTTHILSLAEDVADRIGIILNGELVALGTLRSLLDRNPGTHRLEDLFLKLTAKHGVKFTDVGSLSVD